MTRVLVAEDSRTQSLHIKAMLEQAGFDVCTAPNGAEALKLIPVFKPNVVLTDLEMPEMNGLQLVEAIKDQHAFLPVVLMTAVGSEEIAMKALKAGAANYVPKHILKQVIVTSLEEAAWQALVHQDEEQVLCHLKRSDFRFDIGNDSSILQSLVAHFGRELERLHTFDEIAIMQITMALTEALTNAINHGNLELSSVLREGEDDSLFHRLGEERRQQSPYKDRSVTVTATITADELRFEVVDEGPGFDISIVPDPTDESNLEKASGRGLMLIHTFMDEVHYNDSGNRITMIKRYSPENDSDDSDDDDDDGQ